MECDSKISKISEEQLREILEEVRKLRRKRKRLLSTAGDSTEKEEEVEHPNGRKPIYQIVAIYPIEALEFHRW